MSKNAIINSSQLIGYRRMDAGFHIAVDSVSQMINDWAPRFDAAVWVPRMKKLPLHALEPLQPLLRGRQKFCTESAHSAIDEYPIEAYCLIRKSIHSATEEWQRRVEAERAAGEAITNFI